MKKFLALLLAFAVLFALCACGEKSEETAQKPQEEVNAAESSKTDEENEKTEKVKVKYLSSIGAYLSILEEEIDNWNATVGEEEGIEIELISEINNYGTVAEGLLQTGNDIDLIDGVTTRPAWVASGWVRDLNTIDNDELKTLIAENEKYFIPGRNIQNGMLISLPLEVTPVKMAVNLDLFEKFDLELPKTWDDVVHAAQVITEGSNGEAYGFGWSNWSACFRRLAMKESMSSTGVGWFDVNTETYDFSPFETPIKALAEMYQNGWLLGADDLAIDAIRAQFAEGIVGMFPAPSYDVSVYTVQFPAKCNWTIIDPPTYEPGEAPYKGVYYDGGNCSISSSVSEERLDAVVKAFCFLNSKELLSRLYAQGCIIPQREDIAAETELNSDLCEQWAIMADLTNYAAMSTYPDNVLPLEGDTYATVFADVMHGNCAWEDIIDDLNARYNTAYQELKEDGELQTDQYHYTYDISRS